jgi:hypothetical protein
VPTVPSGATRRSEPDGRARSPASVTYSVPSPARVSAYGFTNPRATVDTEPEAESRTTLPVSNSTTSSEPDGSTVSRAASEARS